MKWSLVSTFAFLFTFTALAGNYKAPDLKISMHPDHSGQVIKGVDWESDYKVEDKVYPDREVASEDEEQIEDKDRSPSSERNPSSKGKKPSIEPWPFDPSEE